MIGHKRMEGVDLGTYYAEPWLIKRSPLLQFWWRFWLGRPMDNEVRTNATFWRSATTGYPSRWLRLAGWQRLLIRAGGLFVVAPAVLLLTALFFLKPSAFWAVLLAVLLAGAALLLPILAVRLVRSYGLVLPRWERVEQEQEHAPSYEQEQEHAPSYEQEQAGARFYERWRFAPVTVRVGSKAWERDVVRPLARALAPQLQRAYHPSDAASWVIVPRDYARPDGAPVRVLLPEGFTGADDRAQRRLVRTITTRLSLADMSPRWMLENTDRPELRLIAPPKLPSALTFADVAHYLAAAPEYEPFLGLVAGGTGLRLRMIGDGPHTLLGAGPGAGKTTTLKLLSCQMRHWGWYGIILDWKRSEANSWAWDLDGMDVLSDIADIHDTGERLSAEIDRRRNMDPDQRERMPRLFIVCNEWNATAPLLKAYWDDLRATTVDPEEKRAMPLVSPALRAYANLMFCGRELGMFGIVESQRPSARIFGGNADVRECFRNIIMARYTKSTVQMIIQDRDQVRTFPKAPALIGEWVVKCGEDIHKLRVPYLTNDEARDFALAGKSSPASPFGGRDIAGRNIGHIASTLGGQLRPDTAGRSLEIDSNTVVEAEVIEAPRTAKLSTLAEDLAHLGVTVHILRNAAREDDKGDPTFPKPYGGNQFRGYTYVVADVVEWARRWHARQATERVGK